MAEDAGRRAKDSPSDEYAAILQPLLCTGPIAVTTAIVTALAICVAVMLLVLPEHSMFTDGSPGRWAIDGHDDQAFVTAAAARAASIQLGPPQVLLLGTSLMRSAFGAPDRTGQVIESVTGAEVAITALAAGGNTVMHIFALLEIASAKRGGIAVIGFNELGLGVSERERRTIIERAPLGLTAWHARNAARNRYGNGLSVDPFSPLHALQFYRARANKFLENFALDRRVSHETRFAFEKAAGSTMPTLPIALSRLRVARDLASVDHNAGDVLSELNAVVAHFKRRRDLEIVLLLDPLNPSPFEDPELAQALARARSRIAEFARTSGIELVTSVREAANAAGGFIDYGHIASEQTRERLRHALAVSLEPAIRRARP